MEVSNELVIANTGFEGDIDHMYLDEGGNVTVGRGHLLPTPDSANLLPFVGGLVLPSSEWAVVKAAKPGMGANFYVHLTEGRLLLEDRADLQLRDLMKAARELSGAVPDAEEWPRCCQNAVIDMVFQMGLGVPGGTHGILSYHLMLASAKNRDWRTVSTQCTVNGTQKSREEWRVGQILMALPPLTVT